MYTKCPNCSALFSISSDQLRLAKGYVRCGGCQQVFLALETLAENISDYDQQAGSDLFVDEVMEAMDESEEETPPAFTDTAGSGQQATVTAQNDKPELFVDEVAAAINAAEETQDYPTITDEVLEDDDLLPLDESEEEDTPEVQQATQPRKSGTAAEVPLAIRESPTATRRSGRETALGLFMIFFLIMLLLGQAVYFMRDDLARRYTELRPWIEKFCQYADCRLGTTSDIAKINIIDREVRSHPNEKNALQVTATFASASALDQPFPDIKLIMSDKLGLDIAGRRFTPQQYLVNTSLIGKGMRPKTPYHLRLELADPGQNVVGFSFSFHETMTRQ